MLTSLAVGEFREFSPGAVTAPSVAALIYLIIAGSVLGFAAYHWLLDTVPTTQVTTYTFVNPVVAVLLGSTIGGETLTPRTLVAAAIIIVAVALITTAKARSSATA